VLSAGMGTMEEIESALAVIREAGNDRIVLLHCVSNYPSQYEEMNLACLASLRDRFQIPVGLSDHGLDNMVSVVASSLGAVMIERHFTLDRKLPGPDQSISMEPGDLRALKEAVLNVQKILGSAEKAVQASEVPVKKAARRSLVARTGLAAGALLTAELVACKRPASGISPQDIDLVLGKKLKVSVAADEAITWDMVDR